MSVEELMNILADLILWGIAVNACFDLKKELSQYIREREENKSSKS